MNRATCRALSRSFWSGVCRWRWLLGAIMPVVAWGWGGGTAATAIAEEPVRAPATVAEGESDRLPADHFVRVRRDERNRPTSLETSVVSFVGEHPRGGKLVVDLVSAVHMADQSYFDQLNKRFETYDVVLYELVAPEGTRIPKGGPGEARHPLGAAQHGMSGALGLTFQLNEVDYTRENFKHADLSPEEFAESMRQKDESILKMMFKAMGHAMADQAKYGPGANDAKMIAALLSKNRPLEMKRVLAEQMEDIEMITTVFETPGGSTLIATRNQRAIDVLRAEVEAGRHKLAIFYGAAHMPDMTTRLREAFPGLEPQPPSWIPAWDMSDD